jgi:hypothetical protein
VYRCHPSACRYCVRVSCADTHLFTRRVRLEPDRVHVRDGDAEIDVTFED